MKDLKYLSAYIIPITAMLALELEQMWSYSTVIFAFGIIPVLEPYLSRSTTNLTENESIEKAKARIYDWLLYLNIPILYGIVVWYLLKMSNAVLETYEIVGLTLSVGIVVGTCGINVAHELGHRNSKLEQLFAKVLLLPALYQHFFIEHNRGHHKNVATKLDPATARFGENLYFFWIRSIWGSYLNAWNHESDRLRKMNLSTFNFRNEMFLFLLQQVAYLGVIMLFIGVDVLVFALLIALVGILLLETINYIEHYGLSRKILENGRYERVMPYHSWNANFYLGRIILYELTRHSDHHFLANKKYQLLDHHDSSPELPVGYPASMLMALVPPIWFMVMNAKVPKNQRV